MKKEQLDELYHGLRCLCLTEDVPQKEAVMGITSHLTQPQGDYVGLLRFLGYYGERYVLPGVVKLLRAVEHRLVFTRVVELGAGFGWLGRGISDAYSQMPVVFVDKRQYVFTDIVADIETTNGVKRVLDELREGDLIVMSELLHCLREPKKVLRPFARAWPMLAVEYMPADPNFRESYNAQIGKFGCKPIANIGDIFPGVRIMVESAEPYVIWLTLPLQEA